MMWNNVSYIVRSQYRLKTLYVLKDGSKTPSSLAASIGIARSHMSRTLKELESRGLVKCLVEEIRGRFFEITTDGVTILEFIEEKGLSTN